MGTRVQMHRGGRLVVPAMAANLIGEVGVMLRMASAVKLYEIGRLSSGAAAQLAGVPRTVFLSRLADYGVETFQLSEEELQHQTRLNKENS